MANYVLRDDVIFTAEAAQRKGGGGQAGLARQRARPSVGPPVSPQLLLKAAGRDVRSACEPRQEHTHHSPALPGEQSFP